MSNDSTHPQQMSLYEDAVYTIVEYISSTNPATLTSGERVDLGHFTIQWSQLDKYSWGRLREKITAYVLAIPSSFVVHEDFQQSAGGRVCGKTTGILTDDKI